jgi:hypothetical protein
MDEIILAYLPYGKENAITRQHLCNLTGFNDANIRKAIHRLRRTQPILSITKGYFIPTAADMDLVQKWLRREGKRAKAIFWSLRGAKDFIKEGGQYEKV